jgi:hypothetical protein
MTDAEDVIPRVMRSPGARLSSYSAAEMCRCYLGGDEKPRTLSARSCGVDCEQGDGPLSRAFRGLIARRHR